MSDYGVELEPVNSASLLKKPTVHELDERRRAKLEEVDTTPFTLFHLRVCLVAGIGFFTDAYDLFAINIASTMLGLVYDPTGRNTQLSSTQDLGIKVAALCGTLVGQLSFGWLADIVGRKRMYGYELIVIIVATFGQAMAGGSQAVNVIAALVVWRVFLGVGVGGDYPLTAVITSEFASTRMRGRMMTAVVACQGWGTFTSALVAYIIVSGYKSSILHDDPTLFPHVDSMWRLLIGIGCVPAAIALYFRLTIPETPRFTMDIERNLARATADVDRVLSDGAYIITEDAVVQRIDVPQASKRDFIAHFSRWRNLRMLFGTSWSWFALDIAFYGLGLNSAVVLTAIHFGGGSTFTQCNVSPDRFPPMTASRAFQNMHNVAVGNLILSVAGLIPGYWACFFFIDRWGRKPIQLMDFAVLAVLFAIMGFGYHKLAGDCSHSSSSGSAGFVALYCLANFFQNFGPNTTTFVIPGEAFPTRYRSTAHGISATSGKIGAILAQVGFTLLKDRGGQNQFLGHILEIMALFMLTGIASTLLVPETKQKSLEELSNEQQEGFVRG
ncbi:phosphate transporter [Punctularia strigosozonata HHB-11173 SS5]|uniref:phosphate transporter n=1 Tax=Punctularia strigosozonata (strain HHB-11173) TaxID=741275 RepID=UPI00044182BA|nr:phosphate transporter [Punctularia strigosozonata HHB-11173 SS5]EIN06400.1 phosphate transporter [Punctularia strigosozonata HHB-11173 SS5]